MSKRIFQVLVILILLVFALVFLVFKVYFFSGNLDRPRARPALDSAASISAVQAMLSWYRQDQREINSLPLLGIMEGMTRISVDTVSTRKYLDILRHSRVFTDSFIIRKAAFFEQVEARLERTNQSADPVEGMTDDFLLFPLRAEQRIDSIHLPMQIVSWGKGDSAVVEVEVVDHRLLVRVKKVGGRCEVDDIRWNGAITRNERRRETVTTSSTFSDTINTTPSILNWQEFWRQLKRVCRTKDTAAITRMTYFPFYNNGSSYTKEDWTAAFPGDIFSLDVKQDEPAFIGEKSFGGTDNNTGVHSYIECDSTFVVGIDHGMSYFAKMQGGYKLVGKLNPG